MYNGEEARLRRFRTGDSFEERLAEHFTNQGLRFVKCGMQDVIPAGAVRGRFVSDNSPLRSLPDFLVTNGKQLVAVDAKGGLRYDGPHSHNCSELSLIHLVDF